MDPGLPDDPFDHADHERMFWEWLDDLAVKVEARTGVEWGDAFDAVADVVNCSQEQLPADLVFEVACRYVIQRDDPHGVGPGQVLRQVREERE
jgi:hypothetical protein